MSHPNLLTLFRVCAVPVIVILMLFPNRTCSFIAALFFSAAAITDYFDGYLARRRGLVSNFGKVMDPVADKLLVSSSFIMLAALGRVPAWVVCIIVGRELAITGLRNIVAEKGLDVSASNLGKYKTGFHVFKTKRGAIKWAELQCLKWAYDIRFSWMRSSKVVVKKVVVKGITAEGTQLGCKVFVCRKFKLAS